MIINNKEYVPFPGPGKGVEPCISYIEGKEKEDFWVDWQSCIFYFVDGYGLSIKENWWIISPYIPSEGFWEEEDDEKRKEMTIYLVTDSSIESDWNKEWDFDRHCPKEETILKIEPNEKTTT